MAERDDLDKQLRDELVKLLTQWKERLQVVDMDKSYFIPGMTPGGLFLSMLSLIRL